ncbi:hypothetical protein B0T22DRAFT_458656 [Podospora appendiculata]|uniref:Secreted protein n=1 Tax=Podospora appendiculata TaxID=314037 RepID=A0AAE0X901_9PEZI|nr:hypothetical protein B0T22DRAFT_458656 [Podospora appendiculata]
MGLRIGVHVFLVPFIWGCGRPILSSDAKSPHWYLIGTLEGEEERKKERRGGEEGERAVVRIDAAGREMGMIRELGWPMGWNGTSRGQAGAGRPWWN